MKNWIKSIVLICLFHCSYTHAQQIYGLAKKAGTFKEVYLATVDPSTGNVSIISNPFVGNHIAHAGATLDHANDRFYYYAPGAPIDLIAVDLSSGSLVQTLSLDGLSGNYFDQIQFNCNDSAFYGLLRSSNPPYEMRLATLDMATGHAEVRSTNSVGGWHQTDYTYDRSTNTYYFSVMNTIKAIDMTNGELIATTSVALPEGEFFDNIAYNCNDGKMYGTYRNEDGIRSARVDLSTGEVTVLTPEPFAMYFAMGSGNVIDEVAGLYYFNDGSSIHTIDLADGSLVNSSVLSYPLPGDFHLFYILQETQCDCGSPITGVENTVFLELEIYPNPAQEQVTFEFDPAHFGKDASLTVYDGQGRIVHSQRLQQQEGQVVWDTRAVAQGTYSVIISQGKDKQKSAILIIQR